MRPEQASRVVIFGAIGDLAQRCRIGVGRELFGGMHLLAGTAGQDAGSLFEDA